MKTESLKVAIVHDWLVGGGAERVVDELHQLFPNAPIYTSYCTPEWRKKLDNKVVTGFLQHWPFSALRKYVGILRIWWFTHLNLSGYDLVISSSGNGEAKGIRVPAGTTHVCYCHSPTHFYWRHYDQYMKQPGFGIFDPLARLGLRILVGPLRQWDLRAAKRPDFFIANSTHIQSDIQRYYGRDSEVIHPPIDVQRFMNASPALRKGFVTAGRQVPYKRTDIIIEACNQLRLPLTVIGRGPDHPRLVKLAGPTITFKTTVSDEEMPQLLGSAEAFIFAAHEDFGITPIEAMATGTPVIAYKAGGALDYVKQGLCGILFDKQTVSSLASALEGFRAEAFDHQAICLHAQQFSTENFRKNMLTFINKLPSAR